MKSTPRADKWPGKLFRAALLLSISMLLAQSTLYAMGKIRGGKASGEMETPQSKAEPVVREGANKVGEKTVLLPRLVDLGASKCIPCKLMAPILEELKQKYAEQFEVIFIDVWKKPEAGQRYSIRMIPTQIFFGAEGKELYRHEGFLSKENILAKWKQLGVEFKE